MAFVKLDCGLLDSTLWVDRHARELFITALLMAEPVEIREPTSQINVRDLSHAEFVVPPGWYGFVPAAGTGIIRRAGMSEDDGMGALERLGSEDKESRSPRFEGRRMVRIDGGYLILNYDKYRKKDYTSAERSRRYRENRDGKTSRVANVASRVTKRSNTQAEAEAEAEAEATGERGNCVPPLAREVYDQEAVKLQISPECADYVWNNNAARCWKDTHGQPISDMIAVLKNGAKTYKVPRPKPATSAPLPRNGNGERIVPRKLM